MTLVQHKRIPTTTIVPNPKNYNQHPRGQIMELKASLLRFGQVEDSVVYEDGTPYGMAMLVGGEGITTAAKELLHEHPNHPQLQDGVACTCDSIADWNVVVVPSSWTEVDVEGYMVAANELRRKSNPVPDLLADLLLGQKNAGQSLASVGSDDTTLQRLLDGAQVDLRQQLTMDQGRLVELPNNAKIVSIGEDGTVHGRDADAYLDQYQNTTLRQIQIVMQKDVYADTMLALLAIRKAFGVDTNADVFDILLTYFLDQNLEIRAMIEQEKSNATHYTHTQSQETGPEAVQEAFSAGN
jgi:hypothetical protein